MNLLRALVLLAIQKCPDDPARPIMGASEVAMTIHGKCAAPLADQKLESIDIEGGGRVLCSGMRAEEETMKPLLGVGERTSDRKARTAHR